MHVLCCLANQDNADYSFEGVQIHRRKETSIRALWRLGRLFPKTIEALQAGFSTFSAYRRLGVCFDVIEYPDIAAEGWLFALLRFAPLVAHLHTPLALYRRINQMALTPDIKGASVFERLAVRRAHMVTSPSRLLVTTLKNTGWLPEVEPQIIPHPIDWLRWNNTRPVQETLPIVLFMARLERNKAPELLVDAMALIRKSLPEAKALFIGATSKCHNGTPYLEWLRTTNRDLTACEFMGHVSRDRLAEFLSTSRVVAIPSWFESYSITAIEAMVCGRPIVVTGTSGVSELIEQTETGRVIPPGDSTALADALMPFLRDSQHAGMIGEAARATVRKHLAPDKIAAQREMVYQAAIDIWKGKGGLAASYGNLIIPLDRGT